MAKQPAKRTGTTRKTPAKAPARPAAAKPAPAVKVEAKEEAKPEAPAIVAEPVAAPEPAPEPIVVPVVEAKEEPVEKIETKGPFIMDEAMTSKVKAEAETLIAKAKEYASEFGTKAKGAATELGTFTKENFEAVVESGKIAGEGSSTIAKDNMAFTKKSFEEFASTAKDMAAVKSPSEFVKMQGDYVRKSFDEGVAQMTKSTEAFMKLMGDAYQPISNRVSLATEKMKSVA